MKRNKISALLAVLLVVLAIGVMITPQVQAQATTFPTQAAVQVWLPPISTTNTSAWYDLSATPTQFMGVHYWTLDWYALTEFGTIPTCSIKAQKNTIKSESGIADLIAAQTCTSTGVTSTTVSANTNYVRINLSTKSGTGKIVAVLRGYFQDPAGTINVSVVSGSTGNAAASATGAAVPAQAGYTGINVGGTLRGLTGTNTSGSVYAADINCVMGCTGGTTDIDDGTVAGGQSTGLSIGLNYVWDGSNWKRLTIGVAGTASTQVTSVQGITGGTPLPMAYGNGTSVLPTDVASVSNAGTFAVQLAPLVSSGGTPFNATAADGATACTSTFQTIKGSQGVVEFMYIDNPNTADEWVHLYNNAAPTVGTTNPAMSFRIPGAASNSVGGVMPLAIGAQFATAITMACTTSAGGTGNPSNALEITGTYK